MAWNEPGGNNPNPWNSGGKKGNNQGPPDLDEIFKKLQRQLGGLFGKRNNDNNSGNGGYSKPIGGFVFIVMALLGVYSWNSFYVVDEKESAVVLRFGKYVKTVEPGLHIYFPPIEEKFQESITEYRTYQLKHEMLTEDENIVDVSLSVQYNIIELKDYVLNVANPNLSLREATQSALRSAVGGSKMHDVLTEGREALAHEVKTKLQTYLDSYGTGLNVVRVNIESAQAPKQVQSAFDDVIRAREDEERSKNRAEAYANQVIPEARGKAERIREEATAYKEEMIAKSNGEANRFLSLLKEYKLNPVVMRERLYIDTMEDVLSNTSKVLVDVKNGNNLMYLPLDKLMSSSKQNGKKVSNLTHEDIDELSDQVIHELSRRSTESRTGRTTR